MSEPVNLFPLYLFLFFTMFLFSPYTAFIKVQVILCHVCGVWVYGFSGFVVFLVLWVCRVSDYSSSILNRLELLVVVVCGYIKVSSIKKNK